MSFYLTLPSNTTSFATNTSSEFRVNLARTVELNGEWQCALASISYPNTIKNVKAGKFELYLKSGQHATVRIPDDNYANVEDLLEIINYYVAGQVYSELKEKQKFITTETTKNHTSKELFQELIRKKLSDDDIINASNSIAFSYDVMSKKIRIVLTDLAEKVVLGRELQYILGYKEPKITADKILKNDTKPTANDGDYPPDISGGINSLFIYTDIITPQIVGDSEVSLLKIVPIQGSFGETIVQEYQSLHYVDVLSKRFNSVQVSIKSDAGEYLTFIFGKTILKLHFRRKRYLQ